MKIGIDISQIVYQGTGVGRYTKELVEGLLKYDQKNQYLFFFSSLRQKLDKDLERKIKKKFSLKKYFFPTTFLEFLWNRLHFFPIEWFFGKTDLILTSDWTEPPSFLKKITVIHDLVFLKFPETLDKKIVDVQKRRLKWVKKETSLIIADSYATKQDIVELLKIDEKKIKVIYPAVEISIPSKRAIEQTLIKYNLTKPFILTVGKIEPRKNLKRLINAFIKTKLPKVDLIIVGAKGWDKSLDYYHKITKENNNIRFLGFVSDTELYSLYQKALFFIYPSIYEGFGYPVVEAMKLKCTVATSEISSLKEIAQGAGFLFNPYQEEEIAKTIVTLYQNPHLREKIKLAGINKGKQFSLKRYVNQLTDAFYSVKKFN